MTKADSAARVAGTFGGLLLRHHRTRLYDMLTDSIDGLDATTYPVLSGLARLGQATASELADQIGLDRTVTTRHATRLERAGLLARAPHPDDARAVVLTLTPRGERTVATMRRRLDELFQRAMSGWTAAQAEAFAELFGRLAEGLVGDSSAPLPASPSAPRGGSVPTTRVRTGRRRLGGLDPSTVVRDDNREPRTTVTCSSPVSRTCDAGSGEFRH